MKRLCWIICFVAFLPANWAAGKAPAAPPPVSQAELRENPIRDPFATENEEAEGARKISDPLEGMNRFFFKFNDKAYFWVIQPAAKAYNKVAPQPCRICVKQFFLNVRFPIRFVNNMLQAKVKGAGIETLRFILNSSLGVGGLFDPAREKLKLEPRPEDFDQTLATYGIPTGIYFDWPLLGPSSVRGTVGAVGDILLTPWTYFGGDPVTFGVRPYEVLNSTSLKLGDYEDFKKSTFDPYISLRSAYVENRRKVIQE